MKIPRHRIERYLIAAMCGAVGVVSLAALLVVAPYPPPSLPIAGREMAWIGTVAAFIFMLLFLVVYLDECREHTPPDKRLGPRVQRKVRKLIELMRQHPLDSSLLIVFVPLISVLFLTMTGLMWQFISPEVFTNIMGLLLMTVFFLVVVGLFIVAIIAEEMDIRNGHNGNGNNA